MAVELPPGWIAAELGELLLKVVGGGTPSRKVAAYFQGDIPWFTVKDMKSLRPGDAQEHINEDAVSDSATSVVPAGTVIVATRIALGRAMRPTVRCAINQDLKALLFADGVDPDFVLHWVLAHAQRIVELGSGTTVSGIRLEALRTLILWLPPIAEQARIVDTIEAMLSDLDAGAAELHTAQRKLTVYRQSVLKAAVEGSLTAGWCDEPPAHGSTGPETGEQLLQRILVERRSQWEAMQMARFKRQGKAPAKDWKSRYIEPVPLAAAALPSLPAGWVWANLDQLLCELRSGTAATSGREVTPFPVLKSSAVRAGAVDFSAVNYLQASQSERLDNYLASGDVLITRLSGSIDYVGCCAVVGGLPTLGIQYPDRIFCGKLPPSLQWLGDWLVICFASAHVRRRIELATKSGAGHKRISLGDLHPMPIPLPPPAEIAQLIMQTNDRLQSIMLLATDVERGLKLAAAQRRNLLKCAFSGQLVPQDPADEPASALLARIQAARAAEDAAQAPKSRPRQPASRNRTSAC